MKTKVRTVVFWGAALALLAFAAVMVAGSAAAVQTGDAYSGSGDWVINNPTTLSNEVLDVSGKVTINSGGSLAVSNGATIRFTVASGEIRAKPGATLTIDGSTVNATCWTNYNNTAVMVSTIVQEKSTFYLATNTTTVTQTTGIQTLDVTISCYDPRPYVQGYSFTREYINRSVDGAGNEVYFVSTNVTINSNLTIGNSQIVRTNYYYPLLAEAGATLVKIENSTLEFVDQGIQFVDGTAQSRYLANVRIVFARGYGVQLTDSNATLFNLRISLDMVTVTSYTVEGFTNSIVYDCGSGCTQTLNYITTYINRTAFATGIGVSTNRGSPWIDGVAIDIKDLKVRNDITLNGSYWMYYYFTYPAYRYNYTTTNGIGRAGVNIVGFSAVNSTFAHFTGVSPNIDNVTAEVHATLNGTWGYAYSYDGVNFAYTYQYNSLQYSYNRLTISSRLVGLYLENTGGKDIDGVTLTMGSTSSTFFNDWVDPYRNTWQTSYVTFGAPEIFGLYSKEFVIINTPQAVTPTDVSVKNSLLIRAGIRLDRTYVYTPTGAANATVFRGTIRIDNVTVRDAPGIGVEVNVDGTATRTVNTYDYTVAVHNSAFAATRAFRLSLNNKPTISTDYQAKFDISGNSFLNGSVRGSRSFDAVMVVNTGGHISSLVSDRYFVDFNVKNNNFTNMRGPLIGIDYSDYRFAGGSQILIENNLFTNVSNLSSSFAEALVKTTVENVTFRGNTFRNFGFIYGVLGGKIGDDTYYSWAQQFGSVFSDPNGYCGLYYTCPASYPFKTAELVAEGNTFDGVFGRASSYSIGFFNLAGRGHATFVNNVVNNSSNAVWVNLFLVFYSYYRFPTEDVSATFSHNMLSNVTGMPAMRYVDPYKSGQAVVMNENTFQNSNQKMFDWKQAVTFNPPTDYRASVTLTNNTFKNITGDAVHATGRTIVTGNSWDGVTGWCLIVDFMAKVPDLATNLIHASGNGYQFSPVIISGVKTTSQFSDLVIDVSGTGIQMTSGNMLIFRTDFGTAAIGVDIKDGYAEVYSSHIGVLSGRPSGTASVDVFNDVGYLVHWADVTGVDSGVPVDNALVVTFTQDNKFLSGDHANSVGIVAKRTVEVWKMQAYGSVTISVVNLPLNIISAKAGITYTSQLPQLAPGESLTYFQDQPAYPIVLVDNIIPAITIASPLAGETVGSTTVPVIGYTFERGSGVASQRVRVDDGPWTVIPTGSSTWSVSVAGLAERSEAHTIYAEVQDIAGNFYSTTRDFFVDVTPPTLTLLRPIEESTLTNQVVFDIQGHVEPADSIVAVNGITLARTGRGDFFYNYTLSEGLNILRFVATDAAGNQAVIVRTITFDRYAPFLQVDAPVNGLLTSLKAVDVYGRSERDARVTVNGLPAFVNPLDGTFVLQQVVLDDLFDQTENLLVVKSVDRAGNVQYENRTVIVDTRAPIIELDLNQPERGRIEAGLPVAVTSLNVKGTTDTPDAIITVAGQEVRLQGLAFSRVIVLREGLNVIPITSEDKAGNHRTVDLRVTRDTVKPVLTVETPKDPKVLTNLTTLEITGYTDTDGSVVTILYTDIRGQQAADPVPTVAVGLPVRYRFEYTLVLNTDGNEHVVQVRASDLAGNFDEKSFAYTAKVGKPFLEITGFKARVTETFVWINGTTEAGIDAVKINGQEFPVSDQGFNVRWNLPIAEGNYSFTVSVRDAAGNTNTWTNRTEVHAAVASTPPAAPPPVYDRLEFQVAVGAGLFGVAIAALAMALSRRREVD